MTDATKAEANRMMEADDVYGLALFWTKQLATRYHPSTKRLTLVMEMEGNITMPIPLISDQASASSPPRPLQVPPAPRP